MQCIRLGRPSRTLTVYLISHPTSTSLELDEDGEKEEMRRGLKTRKPLFLVFVPVATTIAVRTADRRCDSRQTDKLQNSKSKLKTEKQLTAHSTRAHTHNNFNSERCCPRTELSKIQNTLVVESEVV